MPEAALAIAENDRDQALIREQQNRIEKEKERSEKEANLKREAELRQRLRGAGLE